MDDGGDRNSTPLEWHGPIHFVTGPMDIRPTTGDMLSARGGRRHLKGGDRANGIRLSSQSHVETSVSTRFLCLHSSFTLVSTRY